MNVKEIFRLRNQALEAHESGDYHRAEKLFLEALYLLDSKEHPLYQTIVYGLGINYAIQGNLEGAKGCFEEGRLNAQKAENIPHELEMLHQMIQILYNSKQYEAAAMLAEEEVLYRERYSPEAYAELTAAYLEASRAYLWSDELAKSEQLIRQALAYAQKTKDDRSLAGVYLALLDHHIRAHKWAEAEEAYRISRDLYTSLGNKKALAALNMRLQSMKDRGRSDEK